MNALTVIVVNYNGGATLRRGLRALWPELRPGWDVVVVDNASSDGSADDLESEFDGVRVIRNRRNQGFAAANNIALRDTGGDNVLLLNPDVEVDPGAIATALGHLDAHDDVGIVGARILLPDGRFDPAARRSAKTPATYWYKILGLSRLFPRHPRFGRYYLSYLDESAITDVDSVVGAFLLIRRSVVDSIGPLDERFFMYCEDEDWCWRARQAGWRVVYHPGVVVRHAKGSSTRQRPLRMAYHFHRSLLLYHRKNLAPRHSPVANAAVYGGIAAGMVSAMAKQSLRRAIPRR
jgi:GT2 family glycosyltransferase